MVRKALFRFTFELVDKWYKCSLYFTYITLNSIFSYINLFGFHLKLGWVVYMVLQINLLISLWGHRLSKLSANQNAQYSQGVRQPSIVIGGKFGKPLALLCL